MVETWEAIKELTCNEELIFKAVSTNENYYMAVFKWCNAPFIRYFEIFENETISFKDAIPVSHNAKWEITKDIDREKTFKVNN